MGIVQLCAEASIPKVTTLFLWKGDSAGLWSHPCQHSGLHPASQSFCDEEAWIADSIFRALEVENEIRPNTGP